MSTPPLPRRFGLLQATALNMINMIGIGPFITIPLLMTALGGPQAMLGWLVALVIVICDGMVWSELGAAMPGSGGSSSICAKAYGRETFGRLMAFLFIWQFILSGPLEIASGYIGFSQYLGYIWPGMTRGRLFAGRGRRRPAQHRAAVPPDHLDRDDHGEPVGRHAADDRRRDRDRARCTSIREIAFDFPPGAFNFSLGFLMGLGAASRVGVYDYLGYYDICYIGDEVKNPGRVIPRSILISTVAVAAIYFGINLSIIGVVPWREFVPADAHPQLEVHRLDLHGEDLRLARGDGVHADDSVDGVRLGVRAAARLLAHSVRRGQRRLLLQGVRPPASDRRTSPTSRCSSSASSRSSCSFFSLGMVIDALITTRILVQFIGQIVGVMLLRRTRARHAAAVSHLALSDSDARRARRLALHLRDHGRARDRVRPGHSGAGDRRVPGAGRADCGSGRSGPDRECRAWC